MDVSNPKQYRLTFPRSQNYQHKCSFLIDNSDTKKVTLFSEAFNLIDPIDRFSETITKQFSLVDADKNGKIQLSAILAISFKSSKNVDWGAAKYSRYIIEETNGVEYKGPQYEVELNKEFKLWEFIKRYWPFAVTICGGIFTIFVFWYTVVRKPKPLIPDPNENTSDVQQTTAPPTVTPVRVATSPRSHKITSAWLQDDVLDFSYPNTIELEGIIQAGYDSVATLRGIATSTGLDVGEINWNVPENEITQPLIQRAAEEGQLATLIAVILTDPSALAIENRLRELLDTDAVELVNQRILERQGGSPQTVVE